MHKTKNAPYKDLFKLFTVGIFCISGHTSGEEEGQECGDEGQI